MGSYNTGQAGKVRDFIYAYIEEHGVAPSPLEVYRSLYDASVTQARRIPESHRQRIYLLRSEVCAAVGIKRPVTRTSRIQKAIAAHVTKHGHLPTCAQLIQAHPDVSVNVVSAARVQYRRKHPGVLTQKEVRSTQRARTTETTTSERRRLAREYYARLCAAFPEYTTRRGYQTLISVMLGVSRQRVEQMLHED